MDQIANVSDDDAIFFDRVRAGQVDRFGHRDHLRLAFVASKVTDGSPAAVGAVCEEAIRRIAGRAGQPDKFHVTITAAWATMVAHHVAEAPSRSFERLLADEPLLSDSRALLHHFSPERLFSAQARAEWLEPDLALLPSR
jgi:hypothetical protein